MNAQGFDASEFCHPPEPFPKIPRVWSFKISFEPRIGLGRKDVLVAAVARKSTKRGDGHVRQLNSFWFIILRLPIEINKIDIDRFSPEQKVCGSNPLGSTIFLIISVVLLLGVGFEGASHFIHRLCRGPSRYFAHRNTKIQKP